MESLNVIKIPSGKWETFGLSFTFVFLYCLITPILFVRLLRIGSLYVYLPISGTFMAMYLPICGNVSLNMLIGKIMKVL